MRYPMSLVLPFSCGLVILACGSVSNDTKSDSKNLATMSTEASKHPSKDAGPVDAGQPETATDPGPSTLAFDIHQEGAPGPIPATVTTDPVGTITIGSYPSSATATIQYG